MSYQFSQKSFLSSSLLILSFFLLSPEAKGMYDSEHLNSEKSPSRKHNANTQNLELRLEAISNNKDVFFHKNNLFLALNEKDHIKITNILLEGEVEQIIAWANVLREVNPMLTEKWKKLGLTEEMERRVSRGFIELFHEYVAGSYFTEFMFSVSEDQINGNKKKFLKLIKGINFHKHLTKDKKKIKLKPSIELMAQMVQIGALFKKDVTKNAKEGNAKAMCVKGVFHDVGLLLVKKDSKKAIKWYENAAEKGNVRSMDRLGDMYSEGDGIDKDPHEAVKWYKQGVENGNVDCMSSLACMYRDGDGIEKDPDEAVKLFMKAIEKDDGFSMDALGDMYRYGNGVERDPHKARELYSKGVENGNVDCMNSLACIYRDGDEGVEKNPDKAVELFMKAAEKNKLDFLVNIETDEISISSLKYTNVYSIKALGDMYRKGSGVEKDLHKAMKWFEKGVEKGDVYSMNMLACIYRDGEGIEKDPDRAVELFMKAAKEDGGYAMEALGDMYREGNGVEKNLKKAVKCYKKGIKKNSIYSMNQLACMYRDGEKIEKNPKKAVELFMKAAERNNGFSMGALGDMYRNGNGVEIDPNKAREWYKKGAERNNTYCIRMLKNTESVEESSSSKINNSETVTSVKPQLGLEENEEKLSQRFKLKEDLLGTQWSFGAPGATLNPTPEGKKLVTNKTRSMQLTKNFTTDKAQKVQIPFNIVVTKGEVTVNLYEFGKSVPLQSKSLRAGGQNGILEFDVPGAQTLTVVISNEIDGQASECTLKELRILVEEKL